MKKVLVTGGAGYIGSHTAVELHHAGFTPVLVDNYSNSERDVPQRVMEIIGQELSFYEANCLDATAMQAIFDKEGQIDAVIHFAALKSVPESLEQPLRYYENNVSAFVQILQTMRANGMPPLVFSSSCTVYGDPDELPVTESSPTKPATSPYGISKQFCEQIIRDTVAASLGLQVVTLRYFNPIGAHESSLIGELPIGRPNNLVPYITQTAAGIREQLTVFGDDYDTPDGSCVRDFIHVVDLAKAHVKALEYLLALEKGPGSNLVVNLGTGKGHTVLELVRAFEKVSGRSLNYVIGPRREGDVPKIWAGSDGNPLNWKAELNIEDAMRDAWNWQKRISGIED